MTKVNKGIRYEYQIKDYLEAEGYYCMRSAGSHGLFDLIGINVSEKKILLIQCKKIAKGFDALKEKLERENSHFNGIYTVQFIVK